MCYKKTELTGCSERGCGDEGTYREYSEDESAIPKGNSKAVKCMEAKEE